MATRVTGPVSAGLCRALSNPLELEQPRLRSFCRTERVYETTQQLREGLARAVRLFVESLALVFGQVDRDPLRVLLLAHFHHPFLTDASIAIDTVVVNG